MYLARFSGEVQGLKIHPPPGPDVVDVYVDGSLPGLRHGPEYVSGGGSQVWRNAQACGLVAVAIDDAYPHHRHMGGFRT